MSQLGLIPFRVSVVPRLELSPAPPMSFLLTSLAAPVAEVLTSFLLAAPPAPAPGPAARYGHFPLAFRAAATSLQVSAPDWGSAIVGARSTSRPGRRSFQQSKPQAAQLANAAFLPGLKQPGPAA